MAEKNELKKLLQQINKALAINPELFAHQADLLISLGKFNQAKKILTAGTARFPDYATGWLVKGNLHLVLKEFEFAKQAFQVVVGLESNSIFAREKLLHIAEEENNISEVIHQLDKLMQIDPLNVNHQNMRQTAILRRIALENSLFKEDEILQVMPNRLRQILLQHNLMPAELERHDRRRSEFYEANLGEKEIDFEPTVDEGTVNDYSLEFEEDKEEFDALQESVEIDDVQTESSDISIEELESEKIEYSPSNDWLGAVPSEFNADEEKQKRVSWAKTVIEAPDDPIIEVGSEFEEDVGLEEDLPPREEISEDVGYYKEDQSNIENSEDSLAGEDAVSFENEEEPQSIDITRFLARGSRIEHKPVKNEIEEKVNTASPDLKQFDDVVKGAESDVDAKDTIKRFFEAGIQRKPGNVQIERGQPEASHESQTTKILKNRFTKPIIERNVPDMPTEKVKQADKEIEIDDVRKNKVIDKSNEEIDKKQTDKDTSEHLAKLAKEVTANAKSVTVNRSDHKETEKPTRIATKTLAELYASQGNWQKAIEVYQELLAKHPDNERYLSRLNDLKDKLENNS